MTPQQRENKVAAMKAENDKQFDEAVARLARYEYLTQWLVDWQPTEMDSAQ